MEFKWIMVVNMQLLMVILLAITIIWLDLLNSIDVSNMVWLGLIVLLLNEIN